MVKQRCIVLIDGSNFYATYYVGAVRTDGTEKVQQMFNNQRRLFAHLRQHKFKYSLGYLLKSDNKFHEI